MLNLRRLEHFTALAEEKTFARAARRLHLTQPALTRSIQTLEDSLGLLLLDRAHDGITLTDAGQTLLVRAYRMLAEARALQREAEQIRGLDSGQVTFGVGVFPAASFLAAVLVQQAVEHPGLAVKVEIGSWQRLLEFLQRGELDFVVALTRSLPPPPGYAVRALPAHRMGFFVRPDHPLAKVGERQARHGLRHFPLISTHMPERARLHVAAIYGLAAEQVVDVALACDHISVLSQVTQSSDSVMFATHEALRAELSAGRLCALPVMNERDTPLPLNLIQPDGRSLSPAAQWMVDCIEAQLRACGSESLPVFRRA